MPHITSNEHLQDAMHFKQIFARYQQARDLISVGAYVSGSDPQTDFAIERIDKMKAFLKQNLKDASVLPMSISQMSSTIQQAVT